MSIVGGEKISSKTEKWWNDGNTRPTIQEVTRLIEGASMCMYMLLLQV